MIVDGQANVLFINGCYDALKKTMRPQIRYMKFYFNLFSFVFKPQF